MQESLEQTKLREEDGLKREKELAKHLADATQELTTCREQLSQFQSEHQKEIDEIKFELSKFSRAATAAIASSVSVMFSKSTRQRIAVLLVQIFRSWSTLTQTLSSKRFSLAKFALGKSRGRSKRSIVYDEIQCQTLECILIAPALPLQSRPTSQTSEASLFHEFCFGTGSEADARVIFKGWLHHAVVRLMVYARVADQATDKAR